MREYMVVIKLADGQKIEVYVEANSEEEALDKASPVAYRVYEEG